ncbi:immunity protein [Pantoea sp. M_9]|uniref:immunity protein n=1 Tax=Pantoea sp. M_9 TaxID=2608041 RepID=UPI0012322383|nr:immunity protein [Pantoea sp. M_9]KAA5962157.1 immunity protein [Pantoea sp. M_9]
MKKRNYGLTTLLILLLSFVTIMTLVVLSGCLCAAFLVYLKNGTFILGWQEDVLFSIERGFITGMPVGAGIWILSKFKGNKEKEGPP